MGFDIYSTSGNEFRHTVSSWYPLWRTVADIANLTDEQYEKGLSNDLNTFTDEEANTIAVKLLKYCRDTQDIKSNIFELAKFCKESNGFIIS